MTFLLSTMGFITMKPPFGIIFLCVSNHLRKIEMSKLLKLVTLFENISVGIPTGFFDVQGGGIPIIFFVWVSMIPYNSLRNPTGFPVNPSPLNTILRKPVNICLGTFLIQEKDQIWVNEMPLFSPNKLTPDMLIIEEFSQNAQKKLRFWNYSNLPR